MVEFAIVFWPQLVLTLLVLQFTLLQYGYLVVQQAADLGARAAAVSDMMGPNGGDLGATTAVQRMAARQCAPLAPGLHANWGVDGNTFNGPSPPANGQLSWHTSGGEIRVTESREKQVYALLTVDSASAQNGAATCQITFKYMLQIPVAAQMLAAMHPTAPAADGTYPLWPITRHGRCVAPWLK